MKTIFDDVDALTREKARADAAEAELAEYRSWSPSLAEALAAANAELAIWRNEDAREAKYEAVSQRCTKAQEALAAARRECEAQDKSATRWAHMYNDLFHSLEPWLRKRRSFLEHEIARGDAFLAAGPRDRWEAESGSAWNVNATGWRSTLPDYRSELTTIRAALAAPGDGEEGKR